MRFIFIRKGKAEEVFKKLAMDAAADRLLEMRYGKRIRFGEIHLN